MSDPQPQQRFDPVAANSVHLGPRSAQPAPKSTRRGADEALVAGGFQAGRPCVSSCSRSLACLPPVRHFTSLLPQFERPNRYLHLATSHRTELPEFPCCHLVAVNQLVEPKRIDLTSVVPNEADPEMFEKICQPRFVITDEKGPSARRLAFRPSAFRPSTTSSAFSRLWRVDLGRGWRVVGAAALACLDKLAG